MPSSISLTRCVQMLLRHFEDGLVPRRVLIALRQAMTGMDPCRMSDAAEKAAEAPHCLSGTSFELNPMMLEPVKRLSEELANALKSRNSWTATVAPFPSAMKVGSTL